MEKNDQSHNYVSRTLNAAEKRYFQLEKEGLAILFGVGKFHNYIYGRHFIIQSDHQPLSKDGHSPCHCIVIASGTKLGKRLTMLIHSVQSVKTANDGLPADVAQLIHQVWETMLNQQAGPTMVNL